MEQKTALTDDQISQLFAFCEKHCVRYYDLQVELVDHLADAVTAEMDKENAHLTFDEALEKVYATFGVMGFAPIIASKQKALLKWTNKQKWHILKSYFTWPKAALTLMFVSFFAVAPKLLSKNGLIVTMYICMACFVYWEVTEIIKMHKQRKLQKQKLLLTENTYRAPGFAILIVYYSAVFFHAFDWLGYPETFSMTKYYAYSGMYVLFVILSVSLVSFTRNLHLQARRQYPAAFKVTWVA
jgi:hypothetical protein